MVAQHYRWDFVGLSTDTKPTPATSEKVVDGSTFYCSDTSKLYVFCKDNWYERKALGGGGGGTTYTAGDGIDITNATISVDTNTIQEKLTAGTGIDITGSTISATGGCGVTVLTSADYNWNSSNNTGNAPFDAIALWKLDTGFYTIEDKTLKVQDNTTNTTLINLSNYNNFIIGVGTNSSNEEIANIMYFGTYSTQSGNGFHPVLKFRITKVSDGSSSGSGKDGAYVTSTQIVNNLTTDNSFSVLSANQGVVLKGLIDSLDQRITALGG